MEDDASHLLWQAKVALCQLLTSDNKEENISTATRAIKVSPLHTYAAATVPHKLPLSDPPYIFCPWFEYARSGSYIVYHAHTGQDHAYILKLSCMLQ